MIKKNNKQNIKIDFCTKVAKIFDNVFLSFKGWINGNFEDDPLPYEIEFILFLISFKNNFICLSFSGGQKLEKINQLLEYSPLETQCFFEKDYYNFFKNGYIYSSKQLGKTIVKKFYNLISIRLIKAVLIDKRIKEFIGKKIYFGEEFASVEHCIKIQ